MLKVWKERHEKSKKKIEELEVKIASLKEKRKEFKEQARKLEDKLEEAEEINEELQIELTKTKQQLGTCEKEIEWTKNERKELIDQVDQLHSTLKGSDNSEKKEENEYRKQLTKSLIRQKELEEKVSRLENLENSLSEQVRKLQEDVNFLTKQLEEKSIKLALGEEVAGSPSGRDEDETREMTSEMLELDGKLEATKKEKTRLESEITSKEKERKELEAKGENESESYKKLMSEIKELKKELESADQEIERLRRQTTNLKEQLNASYLSLQEEIEKKKEMLDIKRKECEDKIASKSFFGSWWGDKNDTEKIVMLLQAQEEITRDSDDKFATTEKEKIIKSLPEFSEELEVLCIFQEELTKLEVKQEKIKRLGRALKMVMIAPVTPSNLISELERGIFENQTDIREFFYDDIYPKLEKLSFEQSANNNSMPLEMIPTILYRITNEPKEEIIKNARNNVKSKEECGKVKGYAILSYVWGNKEKGEDLSNLGKRTLLKAVKTCQLKEIDVDYLWMDQLCIRQEGEGSKEEKEEEVPKMGQYYSNAKVTLISIHSPLGDKVLLGDKVNEFKLPEILKVVVRSDWFSRSWTFQEGWLSKWTIFMFDDYLIDGRVLANQWVLGQPSYTSYANYKNILDEGSQKIATPLGWAYYKDKYNSEDKVSLSLNDSLRTIKGRGRGISIDGIYSILGLLPYGHEVKVRYKGDNNEWDGLSRNYTNKELEERLLDIIKIAWEKGGRGEFFSWYGAGNDWLPEVNSRDDIHQKKTAGGTSIEGGLTIIRRQFGEENFSSDHIKLTVFPHTIKSMNKEVTKKETDKVGFMIDSGACTRDIEVENINSEITLLGAKENLQKMQEGDILLLLSKKEWRSNKPFALVVREKNSNTYQRIGLVEIGKKDREKLQQGFKEKKIIIKMDETSINVEIFNQLEQQLETKIQVPPK